MKYETTRTVHVGDCAITYCLERKAVRNMNLRIRKDGSVYVSIGFDVPYAAADAFVQSKVAFIMKAKVRIQRASQNKPQPKQYVSGETIGILGTTLRFIVLPSEKNVVSSDGVYLKLETKDVQDFDTKCRLVNQYIDKLCRVVFEEVLDALYPRIAKYGVGKPLLRIRDMKTRWGSCLVHKGIITLNRRLIEMPRSCIEYVTMHELCHLLHPNHSSQFYSFLSLMMPDWKERKSVLDHYTVSR